LWKLPRIHTFQRILDKKLGMDRLWIWIEEWLKPHKLEIIEHENVFTMVHHGGASKFLDLKDVYVFLCVLSIDTVHEAS
jgi:hypothetical protein